jgi:hypothetical protein
VPTSPRRVSVVRHASSTRSVPMTFVSKCDCGSSRLSCTSISAARWMHASISPSNNSSTLSRSETSPIVRSHRSDDSNSATFRRDPFERSSRPRTVYPRPSNSATTHRPMNPAAPVIATVPRVTLQTPR